MGVTPIYAHGIATEASIMEPRPKQTRLFYS